MHRAPLALLIAALLSAAVAGTLLVSGPSAARAWHTWDLADERRELVSRRVTATEHLEVDGHCVAVSLVGRAVVRVRHDDGAAVRWWQPTFGPRRVDVAVYEGCPTAGRVTDEQSPRSAPAEVDSVELQVAVPGVRGGVALRRTWQVRADDLSQQPTRFHYGGYQKGWRVDGVAGRGLLMDDTRICLRPELGVTVYTHRRGAAASYSAGRRLAPVCLRPLDALG